MRPRGIFSPGEARVFARVRDRRTAARRRAEDPEGQKKIMAEKQRRWYVKHGKSYHKAYNARRPEVLKNCKERYRKKHKSRIAAYMAEWRRRMNYSTVRRRGDMEFRLLGNCRHRVWLFLKGKGKSGTTRELLGCTLPELVAHLESTFQPGMNWDNYGEWHVDHRIPCDSFRPLTEDSLRRCFHFKNLQALWGIDNIVKSNKAQPTT